MKYLITTNKENNVHYLKQYDKGKLVSWLSFKRVDDGWYLVHIETLTRYRRRGYALLLLKYFRRNISGKLHGNWRSPNAKKLFKKAGFKIYNRYFVG